MAATTTQSAANLESVITLVGSTTPESAVSSTSILAGAGIERSESINFPNADAKLTLGNLGELTKKALSAVKSVIEYKPSITVYRDEMIFQDRMWSATDAIQQQIGKIADQLNAIKDTHANIKVSNTSTKEENVSAAQAISEIKVLALGLTKVLQSISEDREEILQIGKESGLREPTFLRKVATCNRAVEAFMSALGTDVAIKDGTPIGKAEIYLAKVVEHVDALEDAKSSIQAIGADSRIGEVKREMAIEFADQFAQKSGAFDSASVTTGNFLNDDDILALYDMRRAPAPSSATNTDKELILSPELINSNIENNLIDKKLFLNNNILDKENLNFIPKLNRLDLDPQFQIIELDEGEDVLTEEPLAGETIIAGDSATQIETTPPVESTERELPTRTISGLPSNPADMKAIGPERSNEHPRISFELLKEMELIADVDQHLSEIGWDAKKEKYSSLRNERLDLQAKVDDARVFIEKEGEKKQSTLQRFGSGMKSLIGLGVSKLNQAKTFIAKSAATLFDLGSQESQLVNEFIPAIQEKFAGNTFTLTEKNKERIPAPLLKAAIPTKYRDRLLSFDDLENKVESRLTNTDLGKFTAIADGNGPRGFSVERYGSDGKVDARLEVIHSREGRVGLYVDKQDGTGKQYMGSIWTAKGTAAIQNFLERNDKVFVKRTEQFLGEYYIPKAK